jgi:hypothetical protein
VFSDSITTCRDCGYVLSVNQIVSEVRAWGSVAGAGGGRGAGALLRRTSDSQAVTQVSFVESSSGGGGVDGQFVRFADLVEPLER